MVDADGEEVRAVDHHVVERRDDVAGADVAAAEPRGAVVHLRCLLRELLLTVLADDGVVEGRFDLAG